MIAACLNKECNQRYRIKPEMIGRFAKCKKCNNRFKIEELICSPKPLDLQPINNDSIEQKTKHNSHNKLESGTFIPSSETETFQAPSNHSSHKKLYKASSLLAIALFSIVALLFIGNCHIISSSNKGLSIVFRDSVGFSEFFINADQITGMPPVLARTRFPLGYSVLEREGVIKSEEAAKRRIDDKEKTEIDKDVRVAQKEIDKIMRGAEKSFRIDQIKDMLLRRGGWIAVWSGKRDSGQSDFLFKAREEKVVVKIQVITKDNLSCERDVIITSDVVKFDDCQDRGITLQFDADDGVFPFKGSDSGGFNYVLKAN